MNTEERTDKTYRPFLSLVAEDMQKRLGSDLSGVTVVFPNKRAGLFFNEHLLSPSGLPVWAPRYLTISELFASLSTLTVADTIDVVFRIHSLYTKFTGSKDTIDSFYGWGLRLLSDFENIDRNLADAKKIFRNIADIKEIENKDFLSERQEAVLKSFFRDFKPNDNTLIKERFLVLWNNLYSIYTGLKSELQEEGILFEGGLCRSVIESLQNGKMSIPKDTEKFVFVGFNVLSAVEERLFELMKQEGKAFFYWDYDCFYTYENPHFEAGYFLRENLEKFPNALPPHLFENFRLDPEKSIDLVAVTSETSQAHLATDWIGSYLTKDEKKTAIVLCNENLLQPILYTIPTNVKNINITKGYPLIHTEPYKFLAKCLNLEEKSRNRKTAKQALDTLLEKLHQKVSEEKCELTAHESFDLILRKESLFQCIKILNRLVLLIERRRIEMSITTVKQLIRQVAAQTTIPFQGEPAIGLQIMGLLETRCLDFDHLLVLSASEGMLPEKSTDNSFIPYPIKAEFGLTTSKHQTALSAYYFYRLLQRARKVTLMYNSSTDGTHKGEMSRFITQLLIESPWQKNIKTYTLNSKGSIKRKDRLEIEKPHDITERLTHLSPSAINAYLRCQVQFYFTYIAKLKEGLPSEDTIEPNTLGTLFHKAAEIIYQTKSELENLRVTKELLQPFTGHQGHDKTKQIVVQAFQEEGITYNELIAEVITTYLQLLISHDMKLVPFDVVAVEKKVERSIMISENRGVKLKGTIDRIDRVCHNGRNTLRVVDYKTGGKTEKAPTTASLFIPGKQHPHYIFQACLYSYLLSHGTQQTILPALFFVNQASDEKYTPYLSVGGKELENFQEISTDFEAGLISLLEDIYNTEKKFVQTEERSFCTSCPFSIICKIS